MDLRNRVEGDVVDIRPTIHAIEDWIAKRIIAARVEGVVIGLSGGIDSALTLALCVGALGHNRVRGYTLTMNRVDAGAIEDAIAVAEQHNVSIENIDLMPTYNVMSDFLGRGIYDQRMVQANLKSRLRMCALYAKANELNMLVAGTTNLTESMIGYYTKYGDGGVDIEPLMGLLKREVRMLAQSMGVPDYIIHKAPTAGLWEGQTDEEELGATYDELDEAVLDICEGRSPSSDCPERRYRIYHKVSDMYHASAHKRQIPPAATHEVVYRGGHEGTDRS